MDKLPDNAQLIKEKVRFSGERVVLAIGEVTGHSHTAEGKLFQADNKEFLDTTGTEIIHEEHKELNLDPGIWQIGQVQEKDWLNDIVGPARD